MDLPRLLSPPSIFDHPLNINDLGDPILVLIFDHLPVEDLLQVGDVCQQWKKAQGIICCRRKSLCLMGPYSKYTTVLLYARYGIDYDQHNCYRLEWADLTLKFCRYLSATFPNITQLEFSGHSDEHTFYFLTRLFGKETWFPRLTALKVIIGPLSYANNEEDDNEFMARIQNHFYSWNDLLEDINFAQFAPQLNHLTLYNANILRDFRNVPLNITENFSNLTNLEELYFGVQCENIADIVAELRHLKHLRKFVIFDDDAHLAQERNIRDDLTAIDPTVMHQLTELCLVYSHEEPETNLLCVDTITERCTSLTDLHLFCSDVSITDLFTKLSRLEHLGHLRLSGFCQSFFGKPLDVPPLRSVHTLHLNSHRLINYSHLKPLVEMCLPNLEMIQQDGLSGLYFMDDFLFPEEDPYIDDSKNRLVVMSPNKRIKAEVERYQNLHRSATARYRKTFLANAQLESASLIFLEQLFPLLSRFSQLKHLRMECPADNFAFLGENILTLPAYTDDEHSHLDTLQTLHLDCSATGDLPCSSKFPNTSLYWPNVQLLKLDGLKAKLNYFYDLSPSECAFLNALKPRFKHLRKVLLVKDCTLPPNRNRLPQMSQQKKPRSNSSSNRDVNFYCVQYLLHKDEVNSSMPELFLMIGQKIVF